jgi:hypothetical protein
MLSVVFIQYVQEQRVEQLKEEIIVQNRKLKVIQELEI